MTASEVVPASASGPAPAPPSGSAPSADSGIVPPWLVNLAALSWRLAVITLLLAAGWLISSTITTVTAAVAVAIVVAAVLVPATRALRRRGRSETASAGIVWALALLVAIGLAVLLAIAFVPQLVPVLQSLQQGFADLQALLSDLQVPPIAAAVIGTLLDLALSAVSGVASNVVNAAAAVVTSLILATFLVFFLLRDGDRAWAWGIQAMAPEKRELLTDAGEQALGRVAGYLIGTTVLSGIVALTDFVFMALLGVPLAAPLALLVFLAGYIPYFGGIITTLIVLIVTLAVVGPTAALILLGLIAVRNVVVAYAIRPSVYGRSVNLHPALVLIALPAGYEVAGIIGLFAAVPVVAVVLTVASAVIDVVQPDDPPALPGLVPPWLDRIAQWSWRLLAALVLVALLVLVVVEVPLVTVPVLLGVILAATFSPVVEWLRGRGWGKGRAIAVSLGGTFLFIAVMVLLAVGVLVEQASPLASATEQGAAKVDSATGGQLGLVVQAIGSLSESAVSTISSVAQGLGSMAIATVLSGLLCFYFLRDGDRLWGRAIAHVDPEREPEVRSTGKRAFEVLGGYMYGTAAISFVGAASQLVIMLILGVPLAIPVFVLSFFLCFIPYIGGFISTGIALLLTIGTGSETAIIVMAIWTLVFNIVTGNIVSPIVYGKTVSLHPAIVLISIPIGSAVAGILGMLLVVPILGVIAVSWRTVIRVMARDPRDAPDAPDAPGAPGASDAPGAPADAVAAGPADAPGAGPALEPAG